MKNSNIQWIGDIPDNWEVTKIGQLYQLRNQKVSDRDFPPLSVTMNGIVPQMEHVAKTNAHDDRKLVKKGDFAINSRSDRRGSCGISKYDGSVSLINTVLQPLNEMNPNYYDWLFHTIQFSDEFYKWGHGIVDDLWSTNWQDMKNISVCVPPLPTQTAIATYLDAKCSEIDGLIADINKQIETLNELKKSTITEAVTKGLNKNAKLKDSGIQWIGMIPEWWRVTKVKYAATLTRGVFGHRPRNDPRYYDGIYPFIQTGDVASANKYVETYSQSLNELGKSVSKMFLKGTIAMTLAANVGDVAILSFDSCFPDSLLAIVPKDNVDNNYLYYILSIMKDECLRVAIISTQLNLNNERVGNLNIVIPPLAEQRDIATYLDTKCTEFDSIISDKQKQISTLEAYKKSLIYEYVTGKNVPPIIDN